MRLAHIELVDIRCYRRAVLDPPAGVSVLIGGNAHGKTSVLEAIHRAAVGSSHRTSSDAPLVRRGADRGYIHLAGIDDRGRRRRIDVELRTVGGSRTRIDGQPPRRAAAAIGVVPVVLFAPEDSALIRGEPAVRRAWLDTVLGQRRRAYAAARLAYERVLRQRNALLKDLRTLDRTARRAASGTLEAWTEQLVRHGTPLLAARRAMVRVLSEPLARWYAALAGDDTTVTARYVSTVPGEDTDAAAVGEAFRAAVVEVAEEEILRGVTLVGPHRDDLELSIDGLEARSHASQGESWSLALALRLCSYELLAEVGERPVVLLDDVFAELDTDRRRRLAAACTDFEQVIITAAVAEDVPLEGAVVEVHRDLDGSSLHPRPQQAGGVA